MNQVRTTAPLPAALSAQAMQAQMNNQMAQAYAMGDPRFNLKKYDRAGFSRGAAQMNQAGVDAAKNIAEGVAQAYSGNLANQQYNALTGLQANQAQEQNAQALGALQQQNAYANQMAALQRQNQIMGLLGGLLS